MRVRDLGHHHESRFGGIQEPRCGGFVKRSQVGELVQFEKRDKYSRQLRTSVSSGSTKSICSMGSTPFWSTAFLQSTAELFHAGGAYLPVPTSRTYAPAPNGSKKRRNDRARSAEGGTFCSVRI